MMPQVKNQANTMYLATALCRLGNILINKTLQYFKVLHTFINCAINWIK